MASKWSLIAVLATLTLAMSPSANAGRPVLPKPPGCEAFYHSNVARAKKLSIAERRARHKFDREQKGFGIKFGGWPKWEYSKHQHYDCSKKGKWYHCRAAAYPCKRSLK